MSDMLKRLMRNARLMAPEGENDAGGSGTDDKFEYVIEDENEEQGQPQQKEEQSQQQEEPGEEQQQEEAPDDEDDDETPPDGETEEQKRERRRKERQERKARQKEREESTKRELAAERRARQELENRLAQLEGRDRSREIAQVDETIQRAERSYNHWKAKFAEAMEQHDGEAATAATEKMLEAREAYNKLTAMKTGYEKSQTQQPKTAINPVLVNHAQKFMGEHAWYKHGSNDIDSRIVTQLDNALAEEGWDPSTDEYWQELRARVKKYLPHRVASGKVSTVEEKSAPRSKKSVVGGGGGESAAPGKQVFKLSKERVQALKDAGLWNDPKQREEAVRRFRDFDKTNAKKG